jgi:hypothetical protein
MTTENQLLDEAFDDYSWGDKPQETDVSGGKIHFAKLRVVPPINIVPFQSGEHFTIPGVFNDAFDEATQTSSRQGLKEFRGMKKGRTSKGHKLYILVAEKETKDSNSYQIIKRFNSWKTRDETVFEWGDRQWPALLKIDAQYRERVKKTGFVSPDSPEAWVYAKFAQEATGNTWTNNEGQEIERHFWTDFVIYPDRDTWKKASDEYFAQFQTQDVVENVGRHYPAAWGDNVQTMLANLNSALKGGMDVEVAKNTYMVAGFDFDGNPVNADVVIAEAQNLTAF